MLNGQGGFTKTFLLNFRVLTRRVSVVSLAEFFLYEIVVFSCRGVPST